MTDPLTPKQRQVLEAIRRFQQQKGFPPTVRELAEQFGHSSTAGIHKILISLQEKGVLSPRESGKSRSYHIIDDEQPGGPAQRTRACPIVGEVVAGMPELALEEREGELFLDSDWVGKEDIFLLKVRGHSMIDADIRDGDLLAVQMTQSCRNGDIIIALLDEEATVKRFFKEKERVRLQPENQSMQPIYIPHDDPGFRIIGKVKRLLRRYH